MIWEAMTLMWRHCNDHTQSNNAAGYTVAHSLEIPQSGGKNTAHRTVECFSLDTINYPWDIFQ